MRKIQRITLGYYPRNHATYKQIYLIEKLFEDKYPNSFNKYFTKYGLRNPMNRISKSQASKLITALKENKEIQLFDKE